MFRAQHSGVHTIYVFVFFFSVSRSVFTVRLHSSERPIWVWSSVTADDNKPHTYLARYSLHFRIIRARTHTHTHIFHFNPCGTWLGWVLRHQNTGYSSFITWLRVVVPIVFLFFFSTSSCIPLRAFVWRGSFFLCRSLRRSAGFFSCFLTILLFNLCAYFAHYYFVIFDTDVQFYRRNYIPNANERAIALARSIYYAWVCISLIFQFVFCFCSCICVDCVWMFQVLAHIAWVSV